MNEAIMSKRAFSPGVLGVMVGLALTLFLFPACTSAPEPESLKDVQVTAGNQAEVYHKIRTESQLTGEELQLLQEYLNRQTLPEGQYLPTGKTVQQMIQEQRGYKEGIAALQTQPEGGAVEAGGTPAPRGDTRTPPPAPRRTQGEPTQPRSTEPSEPPSTGLDTLGQTAPDTPDEVATSPESPPPDTRSVEPVKPAEPQTAVVPSGEGLRVRLEESISSKRNQAGDRFRASLDEDLVVAGHLLARKGSQVTGRITEAKASGRVKGRAQLALTLERLVSEGETYTLRTGVLSFEADPSKKEDAKKIGIGAGAGAIIGAIAGGGKGAAVGGAIGAGAGTGAVLVTAGDQVEFGVEQPFEFKLREALEMKIVKP